MSDNEGSDEVPEVSTHVIYLTAQLYPLTFDILVFALPSVCPDLVSGRRLTRLVRTLELHLLPPIRTAVIYCIVPH